MFKKIARLIKYAMHKPRPGLGPYVLWFTSAITEIRHPLSLTFLTYTKEKQLKIKQL